MSARPAPARRLTLRDLAAKKAAGEKIVMVTAYDHPSAQIVEAAGVDVVLVGDSAAMTVLGYDSTVPVTIDEMLMLTKAVRRGLERPLLVGDLPFGSYEASDAEAIATARRFVKEAGVDLVKIERGGTSIDRARALVSAGIPVVGHVGLTPQTAASLGGYRAQGRRADAALAVIDDAIALQDAGCTMLVIEAVPSEVTAALMPLLEIPVVGIGAGADGSRLTLTRCAAGPTRPPSTRTPWRGARSVGSRSCSPRAESVRRDQGVCLRSGRSWPDRPDLEPLS